MKDAYKLIVVGSGISGMTAALEYRNLDARASILVIDEENEVPYKRTKLSKELAAGFGPAAFALHAPSEYAELQIDVVPAVEVLEIDPVRRSVRTHSQSIGYEKLLLTTGSCAVVPPGVEDRLTYVFWNQTQALELRRAVSDLTQIAVWGGGVLAVELAEQLTLMKKKVRLYARSELPMNKELDREASGQLKSVLTRAGIEWIVGQPAEKLVVAATGTQPNTALARKAGIRVDRGIVVDGAFRTSVENVWSAGSCAQKPGGEAAHLWHQAEAEGRAAARSMFGIEASYRPGIYRLKTEVFGAYFFSMNKQDNSNLDTVVSDGTLYQRFYWNEGKLVGVVMSGDRERAKIYENAVRENWSLDSVRSNLRIR